MRSDQVRFIDLFLQFPSLPSVSIVINLVHLTLQLDTQTRVNLPLQLLFLLFVFFNKASQFTLIVDAIAKFVLDLIVSSQLCFEHCLSFFLLLDFFINFSKLVTTSSYLGCLITRIHDHVFIQAFLEILLLRKQVFLLLLILLKALFQNVDFWLVLILKFFDGLLRTIIDRHAAMPCRDRST